MLITIVRLQKELALAKEIHKSKNGTINEFSKHETLNALNLDILMHTGALKPNTFYDLVHKVASFNFTNFLLSTFYALVRTHSLF